MMRFLFPLALFVLAAPAVHAADLIEISGDWQAFTDTDDKGRKICFAGSHPTKSEGNYKKRGEPFLMVTHWPADKAWGEVRFDAGYTLKTALPVTVTVGKHTFALNRFSGESVWAPDAKTDTALVRAMKAGATLVVRGVSSRGTKTTDTFSLKGSSAALKAIDRVCGR